MSSQSAASKNENGTIDFVDVKGLSRDRPWLWPSNRKLRHLQGISLRNLSLSRPADQIRGKTNDDGSLPYALKSPTKLLAQHENRKLEHSRSSIELKSPPKQHEMRHDETQPFEASESRPLPDKLRRRSTLNWTNALPRVRQKKLEDVTGSRMANTWFSLYCSDSSEPVYISEVIEKAMNPNFRFFDLNVYGPSVTRRDDFTLKFWVRTEGRDEYTLLIQAQICLSSLQFIGKTLEIFHHPLSHNCILFHLSDGIYTTLTDIPFHGPASSNTKVSKPLLQEAQSTSSFDALMRLSNLDDCIQDALYTREKLTSRINDLLEQNRKAFETINAVPQLQESLASTNRSLSAARKQLTSAQNRRSNMQASLQARRFAIRSGSLSQEKAESHLISARANLSSRASLLSNTEIAISGQISRICEDLLRIYPIEAVPQKSLLFTIRDLPLPNASSLSSSSEADPMTTAAALSMVAHVTHLLSFYLSTVIPYPPIIHGSTSTIIDPISTTFHSTPSRTFPLYQKGAVTFRFEYAVFLLNSDIQLLMSKQGLRMVNQRHTLPNLKYLLYVLTDAKGELPTRKQGDVKGLGGTRKVGQRMGSDELSVDSGDGSATKGKQVTADRRRAILRAEG